MTKDPYDMRQIIVLRKDLKMPLGKCVAQGAHASMAATLEFSEHPNVKEWLSGPFTKICVWADDEEQMERLLEQAKEADLPRARIVDAGLTVFKGVATLTAIAIGPAPREVLKPITGNLKLA